MKWYVLRTITGKEDVVATIFRKMFSEVELIYPKRKVNWRKQGKIISLVRPLFEGYFFVAYQQEKIAEFSQLLRMKALNIAWLVYSAGALVPILPEEQFLLQRLLGKDGIVEASTYEKFNDKHLMVSGPLVGLDHIVKKVSWQKRRITVEVPILEEKKEIELAGELKNPY